MPLEQPFPRAYRRLDVAKLRMGARNRRTSILDVRIVLSLRVNLLRFVQKVLALAAEKRHRPIGFKGPPGDDR
jgi:hypothetical protein